MTEKLVLAGQGPNYEKYIKLGNKLTNKPLIKFLDKKSLLNFFISSPPRA